MSLPEGNDIFFEDFIRQEQQLIEEEHSLSEIQKFYEGTTIFITGATGFFGKILLEKLLRLDTHSSAVTLFYLQFFYLSNIYN